MSDNFADGYIHVDYSHMNNTADDLVSQTRAIANTLSSLEMELNSLRQTWVGQDREEYEKKQQAWNGAVTAMENMLTRNAALLTDVSDGYQYSERSLTQMWSSVRIGR
ncbi:WXG100 family type VII secretion target [Streptomyces sp. NPDC006654]|uniref:WXG100 family type VII secretion target n=1 Tax=Streptomyces sp. NPDC006654 TaxID=3156897 RepID=UPI0033FF737C